MGKIKKLVGSEFLKLKGTWIFWIHLGVPVAGAGLFLLYGVAAKENGRVYWNFMQKHSRSCTRLFLRSSVCSL
ncbi:MAG: hypothetical protein ACLUJR_05415 [Mediterraneibacter gnavus]